MSKLPKKTTKEKNLYAGHRARLREKFLKHKIMDGETFELLLTYVIPRRDVKLIAKRMLLRHKTVHGILMAPIEELTELVGVGINTAIFIKSLYEIMIQDYKYYLDEESVMMDYDVLGKYCLLLLSRSPIEELHVLYFDRELRLIVDDTHSSGTSDATAAYPREILKRALNVVASHVILVHNHPDKTAFFSIKDIELTMEVKRVLGNVGISMFDHLLVCRDKVVSAQKTNILREFGSTEPVTPIKSIHFV